MTSPSLRRTSREVIGKAVIFAAAALAFTLAVLGVLLGPLDVSLADILKIFLGSDEPGRVKTGVVLNIRLPNMIMVFFVDA